MIKELRRGRNGQSEMLDVFNRELENIKNNQIELKNTIILVKKKKKTRRNK